MKKLGERLSNMPAKRDDDTLYGELLASNLKKLSEINKLQVKHEIDNIVFRYLLKEQEKQSSYSLPVSSNQPLFHSTTPNIPESSASLPVQDRTLAQMGVSELQNTVSPTHRVQSSNEPVSPVYKVSWKSMLQDEMYNNQYTPGYLFQRQRDTSC